MAVVFRACAWAFGWALLRIIYKALYPLLVAVQQAYPRVAFVSGAGGLFGYRYGTGDFLPLS